MSKELIEKQQEYIKFLEDEITKVSPLLTIHNWLCPEEIILKGNKLREEIKELKQKYE